MDIADDQVNKRSNFFEIFPKSKKEVAVPTKERDLFYNTNHKRRGIAVIFNQENFILLKKRNGTNADGEALETTLRILGFETKRYNDLSLSDIHSVIEELGNKNFSDCDCLFIAVLSHGERGILYAKDEGYSHNVLFDRFTPDKCPSLAGKPKIYVIQACQGDKFDPGIEVRTVEVDSDSNHSTYRIPLYADFLVAYSTIPEYYSWRNSEKGSWFIQALCDELGKHWQEFDFLTILTFLNGRVAFDFESNVPNDSSMHRQKQMPYFATMLTRILKFSPKAIEHYAICNNRS